MTDFRDIVDIEGLGPEEETRLRRVHELLVQAGPPPDLPPSLERTPEAAEAEIVQFPLLPKRRWAVAGLIAATLVAIAFVGGYAFGHSKGNRAGFKVSRIVAMHAATQGSAQALVRLSYKDTAGNWPMEIEVNGLPKQADRSAYYALWLTRGHKPVELCGTFRITGDKTTIKFSVPYNLKTIDGWVVTAQPRGVNAPGRIVLTT